MRLGYFVPTYHLLKSFRVYLSGCWTNCATLEARNLTNIGSIWCFRSRVWSFKPLAYSPYSCVKTVVSDNSFFYPTMFFSLKLSQSRVEYRIRACGWTFSAIIVCPAFTPAYYIWVINSDIRETPLPRHRGGRCMLFYPAQGRIDLVF